MYEFFIVYSVVTGTIINRALVEAGRSQLALPREGRAVLVLPYGQHDLDELDLAAVKAALVTRIDAEAKAIRARATSDDPVQIWTYIEKEREARAWQVDPAAETPILTAEAAACGMTMAELVADVMAQADAWRPIGAALEAYRRAAKVRLQGTETVEAALVAGTVDWSALAA